MRGRELEAILVEMSVLDADLVRGGFDSVVSEAAARASGKILFDVRIDGDPDVQHLAAIAFAEGDVAFLLLGVDGTEMSVFAPPENLADFIAPLSRWFALPLHDQAVTPFQGAANLLMGAIRRCGYRARRIER